MAKESRPPRYHDLDALRAFAMILGILYHLALSFGASRGHHWIVRDESAIHVFDFFALATHGFRMQLFFLIAGFFAHLVVSKKGTSRFAGNRIKHILLPFILGFLVLVPLLKLLEHYAATGTFSGFPSSGWFPATANFLEANSPVHLWFLYYLMLFYCVVVVLHNLSSWWFFPRIVEIGKRLCQTIMRPGIAPCFLLPITFIAVTRMYRWGVDPEYQNLVPQLRILGYYFVFFGSGWVLFFCRDRIGELTRDWRCYLALAVVAFAIMHITYPMQFDEMTAYDPGYRLVHKATLTVYTWLMIFGCIGLFREFFGSPNRWARWIADSSYWLYLAHLPLVIWLQLLVAQSPAPALLKFPLLALIVVGVLLLTYRYLVRYTWIGTLLNGPRKKKTAQSTIAAPLSAAGPLGSS